MEEETQTKLSRFLKVKSDLGNEMCEMLYKWKKRGMNVKYVRLDNAGENKSFEKLSNDKKWKLDSTFKYTGAGIPQRSHLTEVGFAPIWKE